VYVLHAATATGPVAVVEVDALALEDEGSHAILQSQRQYNTSEVEG